LRRVLLGLRHPAGGEDFNQHCQVQIERCGSCNLSDFSGIIIIGPMIAAFFRPGMVLAFPA
jgi:hypothetical protein